MGPGWVLWRGGYALRKKTGLLKRRFPAADLHDVRLRDCVRDGVPTSPEGYRAFREQGSPAFFFEPGRPPDAAVLGRVLPQHLRDRILSVADDYCRGRFLYFSRQAIDLGRPPNWLRNPFLGADHHARTHWCDYPTFSPTLGDVKDVWEPSRFACAFWLVRAYALTRDERYAEAFWGLFESWCAQNPPNMGPNWKCGQETAFRTFGLCFGLYGFWNARATTLERVTTLVKLVALQADRIAGNIDFAVSQKNNHSISEAVGLLTVGLLFPELRGADRWLELGRRVFEKEVCRQIYDDGSYVQHSMNYHRLMLHDCFWAIRLAELNNQPLSEEVAGRAATAGEFLFQMLDAETGRVPNYGANDGALILPLTACDYRDYRPAVQAARYQAKRRRVLAAGPWDELLLWLYGPEALAEERAPAMPTSCRCDVGGYYTLRGGDTWCMVRCHSYRDRPAHVDMLHLDLWYKGVNVFGDSGTCKYYIPNDPALERYFKDIVAHNTIQIDEVGPLELVSRFLWLPWPGARCLEHRPDCWRGEHFAYDRAPWHVVHRRSVELVDERTWVITDDVLGRGRHDVVLRWHLADGPFELDAARGRVDINLPCGGVLLEVERPAGFEMRVHRGVQQGGRVSGWASEYYGEMVPRPTLEVAGADDLPVRLVTRIGFDEGRGG
jgi:hypothetical protein